MISSDDGLILIPLITNPQNLLHKLESLMSTITIVDDVTRFGNNLQNNLLNFQILKRENWDNKKSLKVALDTINENLQSSI